ncbi:MAG TPA: T9SS type A sorting domain-containing protein [Candidatus Marinimicrobia bacterium]|nr:T9SS type A sorting domain-containing protein [Candidatus Neomarinimicrobiota bacterium]
MVFSEAFFSGDGNPYYHTSNDKIEHFNLDYYHALSKLAVATISHLAFYNTITVDIQNEANDNALDFVLEQNYPNPFNPTTIIKYSIPELSSVTLKIYDVLGNEVEALVNEKKPAGTFEITWYADQLTSGVYFYQLKAGSYVETKKMVLLK